MKIQYMSDLHLEFTENSKYFIENELPVTGDVLVLAGDIFYLKDDVVPRLKFWDWASKNYRQVLLVPGNHEYYNFSDIMDRGLEWKWMFRENVGYYQNQVVGIDDTDFILCTFWSRINPAYEYFIWKTMPDFHQIKFNGKFFNTGDFTEIHNYSFDFIKRMVVESTAKHKVVVTHHLPSVSLSAPHHRNTVLNSAFATEYGEYILDSGIDAWIYGHSHTNIETEIGQTKILTNQFGYIAEGERLVQDFIPGKYIIL